MLPPFRLGRSVHRRPAAALLVLLRGAARARIVTPDLGSGGNQASSILIVDAFPSTDQSTSDSFRNTSAKRRTKARTSVDLRRQTNFVPSRSRSVTSASADRLEKPRL